MGVIRFVRPVRWSIVPIVLVLGAAPDVVRPAHGGEIQVPTVPDSKPAPRIIILGPSGTPPPSAPVDPETAKLTAKASAGDHDAQVELGKKLSSAKPPKLDEAFKWFQRAADAGNAEGAHNLGLMLQKNPTEAAKWFRVAAERGYAPAQATLGNWYYGGLGVPQDFAEALKWNRAAADQNNAVGQNNLAGMYAAGRGVAPDFVEAIRLYRRAADQGDAVAQANLGFRYLSGGKGVAPNPAAAYFWLNLAAARLSAATGAARDRTAQARDTVSAKLPSADLTRLQQMAAAWKPGSTNVPPDMPSQPQ